MTFPVMSNETWLLAVEYVPAQPSNTYQPQFVGAVRVTFVVQYLQHNAIGDDGPESDAKQGRGDE